MKIGDIGLSLFAGDFAPAGIGSETILGREFIHKRRSNKLDGSIIKS